MLFRSNVCLDVPTPGYHVSLAVQAFNCGFALAGLPFIVAGFMGVRMEKFCITFFPVCLVLRVLYYTGWCSTAVYQDSRALVPFIGGLIYMHLATAEKRSVQALQPSRERLPLYYLAM